MSAFFTMNSEQPGNHGYGEIIKFKQNGLAGLREMGNLM
jgi:hypothetical protein